MKILSPQTMGVAVPRPGSFTFHLMFSSSLQVVAGEASGDAPVSKGPRHFGQFSSADVIERTVIRARNVAKPTDIDRDRLVMRLLASDGHGRVGHPNDSVDPPARGISTCLLNPAVAEKFRPNPSACELADFAYCDGNGQVSKRAVVAQLVAEIEINWSLPCGKPLSKYTWIGLLRVATRQDPSSCCVRTRNSAPFR